jgi:site-specific recombinase XerD
MTMIKYLDQGVLSRLFATIKKLSLRDYCLFSLCYRYGLRISEAVNLKLADIKPNISQPMEIYVKRSKNGVSRHYPLSQSDGKLLKKWIKKRQSFLNAQYNEYLFISSRSHRGSVAIVTLQAMFQKYCKLANIPRDLSHPHVLRHSTAVSLLSNGSDVFFVKEFLGHRTLASTLQYSAIMPESWSERSQSAVESLAGITCT